ncbi:MAG: AAA family ATPase [Planctomycetota bacterium]
MRTIAIINQKGGCGKTTVSINLAAVLAGQGRRTLLVDMDPQGHCALGLAVPTDRIERSMADLLAGGLDGRLGLPEITWQITRKLDLAPATVDLAAIEQRLSTAPDRDRRLAHVLSTAKGRYDFCIIDCPPAIGLLTFNALRACDEVIIPVETGYFALQGSVRQARTIEAVIHRVGHRVRYRVLPTLYDVRTKLAREILGELRRHFGDALLPSVINFNSKLKEAASVGQPITEYDAASRGMQDFEQLVTWLIEHPPTRSMLPTPDEVVQVASSEGEAPPVQAGLSRAAELVERARALSARSTQIAQRIQGDPEFRRQQLDPSPAAPAGPLDAALADGPIAPPSAAESKATAPPPLDPMTEAATARATPPLRIEPDEDGAGEDAAPRFARLFGARVTSRGVLFVQPEPGQPATTIGIAGDFNGWDPAQTPLQRDPSLGVWQACLTLPAGRHHYRLVVDGQWVQDPYNQQVEANPFGEPNNVVEVTAEQAAPWAAPAATPTPPGQRASEARRDAAFFGMLQTPDAEASGPSTPAPAGAPERAPARADSTPSPRKAVG